MSKERKKQRIGVLLPLLLFFQYLSKANRQLTMIMMLMSLRELWSEVLLQQAWSRKKKREKCCYLVDALRRRFPSGVLSVRVFLLRYQSEQYTATLLLGVYSFGVVIGGGCRGGER